MSEEFQRKLGEASDLSVVELSARINLLYADIKASTDTTHSTIRVMLIAAWRAGALLSIARAKVWADDEIGWCDWLDENFKGHRSTARRYLKLYEEIEDIATLPATTTIRQAYLVTGVLSQPNPSKPKPESNPRCKAPPTVAMINNKFQAWFAKYLELGRPLNAAELSEIQNELRELYKFLQAEIFRDEAA